jgi:hypothetical protein
LPGQQPVEWRANDLADVMLDALIPVDALHFAIAAAVLLSTGLVFVARRPEIVIRNPRRVLSLLALVTIAALAVLVRFAPLGLRLEIDPSTELLLPAGDPAKAVYRKAVLDFGDDQVFVIAMESDDVFTAANLGALRRVSDRISRLDGVRRVQSLVDVTSFRYVVAEDWIEVRPLIEDVPTDLAALAELRQRARADPLYDKILLSADARTAAINVSFREMSDGEFIDADLDGAIRAIVESEAGPERRFHVSGRPHIKSRMYHTMVRDLAVLIPAAFLVVSGVLLLISRSVRGVVLPMANVAVGIVWTFACIALMGRPLTVLTVLLAPTMLAIGSVYGVHVVGRYEDEAGADAPAEATGRVLRQMILPVLIAGLTTAVGFAALLITDVPAVFEIGAFSVFGVASVTLLSLSGIPAALVLLPPLHRQRGRVATARRRLADGTGAVLERLLVAMARAACGRPLAVIGAWSLAVLAALVAIPRISVDTDYLSFFDEDSSVRVEFETINSLLAGVVPLYVVFQGSVPGLLREPGVLRDLEQIQRRIDTIPGVSRTLSCLDTMRVLNRVLAGDDPAEERIPDTRPAVTELFFLLPKGDVQRFVTVDHSSANLVVRTGAVGSAALRELTSAIEQTLRGSVPAGLSASVTGNPILLARAADGVAEGQPRIVGLATLTIFLLLAVGLRSVRVGLVAMVPNVVPVIVFFGVLGAGVAPLSLPTSLIGSTALGIAIDATAHYLVRYRGERLLGRSPEEAVFACNRQVGRPIAIASAVLILGFLSVTFSEFATLREFGVLTALTMAICFAADLLLLPAMLVKLRI